MPPFIVLHMGINYYLSVFPMEALIASQLEPKQFGTYMATGSKKGAAEQIIFCRLEGEFEDGFDWDYAHRKCVPHSYGDPKHSVYLGVYRVLERIPLEQLGPMYLATRDGRTLEIEQSAYETPDIQDRGFYVYQELCPVNPVIVSKLDPKAFGEYISGKDAKVHIPKLIYADLKVIDLEHPDRTGHLGTIYDRKIPHLMECIASITSKEEKLNKTLTRTHVESFSFQVIDNGIYATDGETIKMYRMPTIDEIKEIDYDWGRSALII